LFDKVKYNSQECFIFARRSSGYFDLRRLNGTVISRAVSYKKIKLLEKRKYNLIERVVKV
ncbi:MAG: HNH endonuclease, partial [Candidatus Gastranaerophilaceae bacterium]